MNNKLIILNYQRDIPAFVSAILKKSVDEFNSVDYVSPSLNSDNELIHDVSYEQQNRFFWILSLFVSTIEIFSLKSIKCIFLAIRHKKFGIHFLKSHYTMIVCSRVLFNKSKKIIKKNRDTSITVLAIWFWSESLALAKLKKKFKTIHTVSYAHSFEVDTKKNPYVGYSMNLYRHKYIKLIIFISETIKENYFNLTKTIYPSIDSHNAIVNYLGTYKPFEGKTVFSTNSELKLVSCSGITPVKRINLIVEALSNINDINITWEHYGDGPLMNDIKNATNKINKTNINVVFHGKTANIDVLKKFSTENYDLFINVSESEGLPVSIMEAISYGIPVLATDVGGNKEIVTIDTGYLIHTDSSGYDIANAIINYSNTPLDHRMHIQKNCIHLWNEKFNANFNYTRLFSYLHDDSIFQQKDVYL